MNGSLEPYVQAHQRLLDLAARIDQRHADAPIDLPTSPVAAEFVEIGERVRQLGFPTVTTYGDCAQLFERENLMLMAVQMSGCGDELEPLSLLFRQWRRDGLLSRNEANDLAMTSPLSRMGDWWMDDGP